MDTRDPAALSDRLYEAALDEDLWDGAIQAYAEAFGGIGTVILRPGFAAPIVSVSNGMQAAAETYNRHWWREDLVVATARRLDLVHPGVTFDDDFISAETKAQSFYFQDFLRLEGIGSIATVLARPNGGDTIAINVQRRYGLPPPDAEERGRFSALSRALTRALSIRMRLGQAEAMRHALVQRLADFDCAAAIADDLGRIVDRNSAFEALASDGVVLREHRVHLDTASAQKRFDAALQAAVAGVPDHGLPDMLMLPRASSVFPLLVRISPLAGPAAERFRVSTIRRGALILVLDAAHAAYPDITEVLAGLGLTQAQAKVVLLVGAGHTTKGAAEALSVGEETVRTHLKGAFARLGLSRQADLIRLVAKVAPFGR